MLLINCNTLAHQTFHSYEDLEKQISEQITIKYTDFYACGIPWSRLITFKVNFAQQLRLKPVRILSRKQVRMSYCQSEQQNLDVTFVQKCKDFVYCWVDRYRFKPYSFIYLIFIQLLKSTLKIKYACILRFVAFHRLGLLEF